MINYVQMSMWILKITVDNCVVGTSIVCIETSAHNLLTSLTNHILWTEIDSCGSSRHTSLFIVDFWTFFKENFP